ncbi:uncharacterized protein LOC130621150 [Hydractinia symbiolongicarpus]|uniref:uncharacterized protein LOC130621150 n=1 Tax=Hydractinia symbiolongicarpus TaxID=13093 RepID=UPI0025504A18|nr:uncharacterized protein LOC130621150 [Hydractinia symbiolongicarpus]
MSLLKITHGSFNQSHSMFGESAGKQCACCSLYAVSFSTRVKSPGNWNVNDIDFIITEADKLYKSLNKNTYLTVPDLPNSVPIFGSNVTITYLDKEYGLLSSYSIPRFLSNLNNSIGDGLLFFVKFICVAILPKKNCVYLFDSHSRNNCGQPTPDGFSSLMKFQRKRDLEIYLHTTYIDLTTVDEPYELQYISIDSDEEVSLSRLYSNKVNREKSRLRMATEANKEKCKIRHATDTNKEKAKKQHATEENKQKAKKQQATEHSRDQSRKRKATVSNKEKANTYNNADAKRKQKSAKTINDCILNFQKAIQNGPYYVCIVCNRSLYKKTVKLFSKNNYEVSLYYVFTDVLCFDSHAYICITCDKYLKKAEIPPQAVWNKLNIVDLPNEIQCLNRLEQILISKRILFKKIAVMPKGQQQKIKGAICNVPIQVEAVNNCLPQGIDSSGVLFVKLKRKLAYRGHVVFQSVRPELLNEALQYLKNFNSFYSDVLIRMDNITQEFLSLCDTDAMVDTNEFSVTVDIDDDNLEAENPLSMNCASSDEMCVIPNFQNPDDEVLDIAPGENKQPQSFFSDQYCEELAFPFLFPTGKFGYKVARPVYLTATKYFNQRLLNFSQRFSSNADYIFFAHYVMQQSNLFNQINIATKKVKGTITAGQLQINFHETVRSFICEGQGYQFMNSIKGTPAYWKHFLYDVLAMVKQLGLPSYFLTLSCADLRWDELVVIIGKLNNIDVSSNELDYFRRCSILNQNPVLTARHFQYRVENFFREILLHKSSPIGQVANYAIKVEFQFRGSPHIHAFLWLLDSPTLTNETTDSYTSFVDNTIRADLPDPLIEPELHNLVSQYQIHSHSNSCRKYKNIPCRFNYGRFFTDRTVIASPLPENMSDSEKLSLLSERTKVLKKVKLFIDENLDPSKPNYLSDSCKSIPEILLELHISEVDYYRVLAISPNQDFEIYYHRPPNSCFVNNYFAVGLLAWKANLDLQPVFNYYKAVSYMCSYFSKSENESSLAMKKAAEESENLNLPDRMRKLALAFLSHRQCSLQEAVYQVLPELWLRKCFPGIVFANTNLPDKRYRVCKSEEELEELPPDSTDVFKRNSLDRYMDRPNVTFKRGQYYMINNLCFAEFLAYYVLDTSKKLDIVNDYQPEVLLDDDEICNPLLRLPKSVPLMSSKEKLKRRNKKRVVRYHTPNPVNKAEEYAHHLLMLFYPFRKESDLLSEVGNSYVVKLNDPEVLSIVNENKARFEPWGDMVNNVLMNADFSPRTDQFAQQENDNVEENVVRDNEYQGEQAQGLNAAASSNAGHTSTQINLMSDDSINELIRSLNEKQRFLFDVINRWARRHVKNLSAEEVTENPPLHLFVTGGAGTGKSHLIKTISASVSKTLCYRSSCIEKPNLLLLAPTGVAAVNINGTTIHSALGISVESRGLTLHKLPDKKRCKLRQELSDVKGIIIDEISMVSNKLLLYVHQRLIEIFGCVSDFSKPFAGLTIILVGDLHQLPPVMQKPIYAEFSDELYNIYPLWRNFQMCELTEVMRQRGDTVLIDLLNNVRLGTLSSQDEHLIRSRFIDENSKHYPINALHIYAENEPARVHNARLLNSLNSALITIDAIDQVPKEVPSHVYERIQNLSQSRTGGLAFQLSLKIGAKAMLTSNIDIPDKLINGQIGTIVHVVAQNDSIKTIYVEFDNLNVGTSKIRSDRLAQQLNAVPIDRVTTEIRTNEKKLSSPVIKRTQFPLMLSWACTVHKVQGLSLQEVVISFNLLKQRSFNNGQMYVALSRVTSLQGLHLIGVFKSSAINVDDKAKKEYQYLRENQSLSFTTDLVAKESEHSILSLVVCNVRSLRKHCKDLSCDKTLSSSDIILCTETQLTNTENLTDIMIDGFKLTCNNDNEHRFSSLAMYYKNKIELLDHFKINGFSVLEVLNSHNLPLKIKILLLYKKKDMLVGQFLETLGYLSVSMNIDIVVGDFNLKPNALLEQTLNGYEQVVSEPTHLGGSILDHVYIKKSLLEQFLVYVSVKSLFFTDHEAITISLRNK